ncbi:UvrD-helicase domain-containing protein [Buchnera aphidicola]|uniref:UvrD-like helicase ATP-binding domain-containing protein n=1 Tax=Buchnera aphidicola subsp. Melaphis rhois TaxID=118103 RepID=A0A4D6YBH1_BUCMH|nr:UvrD-helicase domain-containing protein [Buchnera aphidicola]QCI23418.1 hypothetical protein D9V73_02110 [Buchnera aphidicola (Melaphis rhois)]
MTNKILISTLDIIDLPLSGKMLIEASAGTGKTFSLIIIYLRLILGIGKIDKIQRPFLVQEILVVTFTEHSKEELKKRIKKYINYFKEVCINKKSNDTTLQYLFNKIKNVDKAINLLIQAEQSISELAIYTIHGFCYQTLTVNTFSSNIYFQKKIITNKYNLYLKSSNIFWNQYFYNLSDNISNIIIKYFQSPGSILNNILPILSYDDNIKKISKRKKLNIILLYNKLIKKIKNIKSQWLNYHKEIVVLINQSNVNKRSYTKSNLSRWINIITMWSSKSTKDFDVPKELKYFQQNYLISKTPIGQIPKSIIFEIIEEFLKIKFSLKTPFLIEAIIQIKKIFNKEKKNKKYLNLTI